ncbi:hypothetical protein SDD30_10705 [Moorella naiadis]|uniref:type II toxin-antitoxin system VapC family toxin n=1 Tax=Moorella naiadis (nom. illeg.) TaxID=3093670 RepID=UPI003D9CB0DC
MRLDSGLDVALGWWEKISTSLKIQVVYIDSDITTEAVKLLRKFDDQTFSLTDVVSFKVMERGGIEEAFAFNIHFKVAGFTILP